MVLAQPEPDQQTLQDAALPHELVLTGADRPFYVNHLMSDGGPPALYGQENPPHVDSCCSTPPMVTLSVQNTSPVAGLLTVTVVPVVDATWTAPPVLPSHR